MSASTAAGKDEQFPPSRDTSHPFDPPAQARAWQGQQGMHRVRQWDGLEAWVATRYADARTVLTDDRFSADPSRPGFPEKSAAYKATVGQDRNIRTLDNPEHDVQKRMLSRDFTVKRVEEMRPAIQGKVDGLIDAMLEKGPPADIVKDLAFPVPTMVICELLGVPYGDREFFGERSYICLSSDGSPEEAAAAGKDLTDYIDRLIDIKDKNPENDLVSRLAVEQLRAKHLSRKEIIDMARIILIAGHETTANMIGLSVLALLQNPDQLADMKGAAATPAFLSNAVDELLRYLSVAHTGRRRVAIADVEVGGQLVRAGEGVIVMNSVADRDESVFPEADRLNLRRTNARATMAFGYGIHQCIGQILSRVELQIVHRTLWQRIPSLQLAVPFKDIQFNPNTSVYGIRSLPVTWKS